MKSKALELILAGNLLLSPIGFVYGQEYKQSKQEQAYQDSLLLARRLEDRMTEALRYEGETLRNMQPFSPKEGSYTKKWFRLRVEKMPEYVRILMGVPEKQMHSKDKVGNIEVYLIYNKKTRFEIDQFHVVLDRVNETAIYTDFSRSEYIGEGQEKVLKVTQTILFKTFAAFGIPKYILELIFSALDKREVMKTIERDVVAQMANEMLRGKGGVYIDPIGLKKIPLNLLKHQEEKLREIIIREGEKSLLGVVLAFSLEGRDMEYEAVAIGYTKNKGKKE